PPSSAISMTIARAAVDGWQHRGLPGIVRLLSRHCRRLFAPGWPTAALILSRAQARVQRQTPPPTPPHGERRAFRPLRPERCSLTSERGPLAPSPCRGGSWGWGRSTRLLHPIAE